nr:MAG TPA: hypothetical protein [Caudoviricetes sp.]
MAICVRCSYWIKLSPRMWVGFGLEFLCFITYKNKLQTRRRSLALWKVCLTYVLKSICRCKQASGFYRIVISEF